MNEILAIGAVTGGIIGITAYFPQFLHLIRIKDSTSISVHSWWLWFLGNLLILVYAVSIINVSYIIIETLFCSTNLIMIILTYRYKK